jgi:hypothetical protein
MTSDKGCAVITGASAGIGAIYADRLARRGYDLLLVARDAARMERAAENLRHEAGVRVEVLPADLTRKDDLARVEARLSEDQLVSLLVNNAGAGGYDGRANSDLDVQEELVRLNVIAVMRLAGAAAATFVAKGGGAIVNLSSVSVYSPAFSRGVYSATKAFILVLSQSMQANLAEKGVYVQAVLPGATATEIWARAGREIGDLPEGTVMSADDLVDAALVGFDRRELITLPSLHNLADWQAFERARRNMVANFGHDTPGNRYRTPA